MLNAVLERITREKVIAVIRTDTADQAIKTAQAVIEGGICVIEVALTVPDAQDVLRELLKEKNILVGAGTVLTVREARSVIGMGVHFITSPVGNVELVPVCRDANVACILGASTPSEIYSAMRGGANMVKVFPVDALGGPDYIDEILKPLPFLKIIPAGVKSYDSFKEYLTLGVEAIALGSLLTSRKNVESQNYEAITRESKKFVSFRDELFRKAA
jgi:2-dehydro-3-deoxyphosphogluconate aldolase / (4S)-4-hydroxy-2-oxoglutarate aldolase